jgi:hypothetical protein
MAINNETFLFVILPRNKTCNQFLTSLKSEHRNLHVATNRYRTLWRFHQKEEEETKMCLMVNKFSEEKKQFAVHFALPDVAAAKNTKIIRAAY